MKIFLDNYRKKRNIKKEPDHFPVLSKNLAEYRTGRKGFIDMKAAVSIIMPLGRQIAEVHEEGMGLPGLRPDTVDIAGRKLVLNEKAFCYEGVIFPGFTAPEIYEGISKGIASDIYSFSALLYYIIVGQPPENAFNRMNNGNEPVISQEMYEEIRQAESIYVPKLRIEEDPFESEDVKGETVLLFETEIINSGLIEILEKGLNLDADKRFVSMRELIALLEPYNTNASTIYPLLLYTDEDEIHNNLIITRKTAVRERKPKVSRKSSKVAETRKYYKETAAEEGEITEPDNISAGEIPRTEYDISGDRVTVDQAEPTQNVNLDDNAGVAEATNVDDTIMTESHSGEEITKGAPSWGQETDEDPSTAEQKTDSNGSDERPAEQPSIPEPEETYSHLVQFSSIAEVLGMDTAEESGKADEDNTARNDVIESFQDVWDMLDRF